MLQNFDEHQVPLAVAAALVYNQLMAPERPQFYDADHLAEVLTTVAQAVLGFAPAHVREGDARRPLTRDELEGAQVRRGATLLVLADGRVLNEVTIRRDDYRAALGALKDSGLPSALQELNRRSNSSRTTR